MANIEDIKKYQTELIEKFGSSSNVAYANVSSTQFSIARHYGGVKINGKHYVYNPTDDSLIREDVVKWIAKKKKTEGL
jgi:hypothetical protein